VYNNSPERVRRGLAAYLTAMQSIGAGNGVRAIRHRRDARAAMLEAHPAVPCWILPQWRVSETLPAEIGVFDLVIIDEASQSDIWALPALLRGKKVLVVGDHKQVSPSAVGIPERKIGELVERFLKEQPNGALMTPDRSVYDLAKAVFAGNSVMLREHFRCVPAIIEFSNREFYQGEIRPLRIPRRSERLDPPLVDVFVKGGYRRRDVNEPEAVAIVQEIKSILRDPALAGRSIGVVTLLGQDQAPFIDALIHRNIEPGDILERRLRVGSPTVFQGDERDIMLMSMVLAKGERGVPNRIEFEQRFNVAASRARDRMMLFRSIDEGDVALDGLNGLLMAHFRSPFRQDHAQVAGLRELCESDFEREMFDLLVARGYRCAWAASASTSWSRAPRTAALPSNATATASTGPAAGPRTWHASGCSSGQAGASGAASPRHSWRITPRSPRTCSPRSSVWGSSRWAARWSTTRRGSRAASSSPARPARVAPGSSP